MAKSSKRRSAKRAASKSAPLFVPRSQRRRLWKARKLAVRDG